MIHPYFIGNFSWQPTEIWCIWHQSRYSKINYLHFQIVRPQRLHFRYNLKRLNLGRQFLGHWLFLKKSLNVTEFRPHRLFDLLVGLLIYFDIASIITHIIAFIIINSQSPVLMMPPFRFLRPLSVKIALSNLILRGNA